MKSGLYGWLNKNMTHMKGRKGQQGFTLIELLVVVTILGVLAAIVTLSLVGLTTNASVQSCKSEYKTVQAALDAFMAANNVDTINPAGPTKDMTTQLLPILPATAGALSLYNTAPGPNSPNYTRNGTTQFSYQWDLHGRILAPIVGAPAGCTPT
jgi:prepilin-type N-terminal cleavage/methylation domain-containing protein